MRCKKVLNHQLSQRSLNHGAGVAPDVNKMVILSQIENRDLALQNGPAKTISTYFSRILKGWFKRYILSSAVPYFYVWIAIGDGQNVKQFLLFLILQRYHFQRPCFSECKMVSEVLHDTENLSQQPGKRMLAKYTEGNLTRSNTVYNA